MMKNSGMILVGILLIGSALINGCGGEVENVVQAKNGDTVKVDYTGTLDDDTVFDTSIGKEPLEFTIGEERLLPAFEQAVIGMGPGESTIVKIPADEAYGPHREDMILVMDRDELPEYLEPEVGQWLRVSQAGEQAIAVEVIDVSESSVTLDANHPLAGKDLTFEIQLVEIVESD